MALDPRWQMDAPKQNLRWCMITQQTSKYMIESRYLDEHSKEEPTADVFYALYVPTFIHAYLHMYLFPVLAPVISYPSNAFAPTRISMHPFTFPLHTRLFTFPCIPSCILYTYAWSGLLHLYRTLSTTLIQVAQSVTHTRDRTYD